MNLTAAVCWTLALGAALCSASGSNQARGKALMVKSLRGQFGFNLVAIVSQEDSTGRCYDTLKVERSADGKIRHTFVAPLCMQGICSLDDGAHSFIYWPDEKRLVRQDSPPKSEYAARVIPLALRNYTFRFEGTCKVAGRRTNCVLATPIDGEMQVRRYFLDAKTAYPLKLETVSRDGETVVKFETKDVQFPSKLDSDIFSIQTLGEVETLERQAPTDLDPRRAAAVVGFTPLIPRELPMGFEIQEVQKDTADDWHALIVRLTDGLVRATMYQWRSEGVRDSDVKLFEKNSQTTCRGIRLVILADLPEDLRERLLDAFVEQDESSAPTAELFAYRR